MLRHVVSSMYIQRTGANGVRNGTLPQFPSNCFVRGAHTQTAHSTEPGSPLARILKAQKRSGNTSVKPRLRKTKARAACESMPTHWPPARAARLGYLAGQGM